MSLITAIIEKKRDGLENSREELQTLLEGFVSGTVKDYQMAAWLMAVCCRGLSKKEMGLWTEMMWKSGTTFPKPERKSFWIDKHSTGGVGDKPSLILVPLVNLVTEKHLGLGKVGIPMVSGRGLGHSGGTLDKLEAVPGFSPSVPIGTAMELIERNGFFMMGQTKDLAPADRLLYALRDVTGTVESIPLIVSSILSKKLAENLDGLVFDVKVGSGAFMKSKMAAKELAKNLVRVAKENKVKAIALLTNMDEPLGYAVGNLLEVEECVHYIEGRRRDSGLHEVVLALAAEMVSLSSNGKIPVVKAKKLCEAELKNPELLERFKLMFQAQGGSWEAFERVHKDMRERLPRANVVSQKSGVVQSFKTKEMGQLLIEMGGGRMTKDDKIDPLVGIEVFKKVGDSVKKGEPVLNLLFRREEQRTALIEKAGRLFEVKPGKAKRTQWVLEKVK